MKQENIQNTILSLISIKTEGCTWDFKEKHHDCKGKLLHDILCLSNVIKDSPTNRYLIFGVSDDCTIKGLETTCQKDNDFHDWFTKIPFAGDNIPDIEFHTVIIHEKKIQVIEIHDKPYKPYYLKKDFPLKKSSVVPQGNIYTRNGSKNTPINEMANPQEIESMWKEKFGIHLPPLEKMKRYLDNFNEWIEQDDVKYYKYDPRYRIKSEKDDDLDYNQEWTQGEIGKNYEPCRDSAWYDVLYYEDIVLHKIHMVRFDNDKKCMVAPNWNPFGEGRFYFYLADSTEYIYQKYISHNSKDDSKGIPKKRLENLSSNNSKFDVPVLSQIDLNNFLNSVSIPNSSPTTISDEQLKIFYRSLDDYEKYKRSKLKIL